MCVWPQTCLAARCIAREGTIAVSAVTIPDVDVGFATPVTGARSHSSARREAFRAIGRLRIFKPNVRAIATKI